MWHHMFTISERVIEEHWLLQSKTFLKDLFTFLLPQWETNLFIHFLEVVAIVFNKVTKHMTYSCMFLIQLRLCSSGVSDLI